MSTATAKRPRKSIVPPMDIPDDNVEAPDEQSAAMHARGLVRIETRAIPIAEIDRDGSNHRLAGNDEKEKIAGLAKRIADEGLLQPVRVYLRSVLAGVGAGAKQYVLAFGFRRCAAAELNGEQFIRAEILPMPMTPDGQEDQFQLHRVRTIENLERDNLNPMEEQIAVAELLEALPDSEANPWVAIYRDERGLTAAAFDRIATAIGRPASWVRDRAYLARLIKPVQAMVIAGSLPIAHAREIALLGDPADQKYLADAAELAKDGHGGRDLAQIRMWVRERMKSLRIVPWKLEDPFREFADNKKICGACVGCRFNTATDRNLFEHDSKPPEDGLCMNKQCLDEKHKVTEKRIEKAVATIVKQDLLATATSAAIVAEDQNSSFVKPTSIANRVKRLQPAKPAAAGTKPKPTAKSKSYEDLVRDAETKFHSAERDWEVKALKAIRAYQAKTPGALTMLLLIDKHKDVMDYEPKESEIIKMAADVRKLLASKATPEQIAFENKCGDIPAWQSPLDEASAEVMEVVAQCWGIEMKPRPDKETFMPPKPAVDAAAKPAKKKPAKKKR